MSPIVTVVIAVLCLSAGCAGGFAIFRYILTGKYNDTINEAEKAAEVIKEKKLLEVRSSLTKRASLKKKFNNAHSRYNKGRID